MSEIYGSTVICGASSSKKLPEFEYSGTWEWRNYKTNQMCYYSDENAVLALLTSGTLKFSKDVDIDTFLVGGGSSGSLYMYSSSSNYCNPGTSTIAFNLTAAGGTSISGQELQPMITDNYDGRKGGSGGGAGALTPTGYSDVPFSAGDGGANGNNGQDFKGGYLTDPKYYNYGGIGDNISTSAFGDGYIFACGGGGGGTWNDYKGWGQPGQGGSQDAGAGGSAQTKNSGGNAVANTGCGGGGAFYYINSNSIARGGGGGSGGSVKFGSVKISANTQYPITIGAGGESITTSQPYYSGNSGAGASGIVLIRIS